jgi:hypothetical protein
MFSFKILQNQNLHQQNRILISPVIGIIGPFELKEISKFFIFWQITLFYIQN